MISPFRRRPSSLAQPGPAVKPRPIDMLIHTPVHTPCTYRHTPTIGMVLPRWVLSLVPCSLRRTSRLVDYPTTLLVHRPSVTSCNWAVQLDLCLNIICYVAHTHDAQRSVRVLRCSVMALDTSLVLFVRASCCHHASSSPHSSSLRLISSTVPCF